MGVLRAGRDQYDGLFRQSGVLAVFDDVGRVVIEHRRSERSLGVLKENQSVDLGLVQDSANGGAVLLWVVVDRSTEVERVDPGRAGQGGSDAGTGFGAELGERDTDVGRYIASECGFATGNANDANAAAARRARRRVEAFQGGDQLIVIARSRYVVAGEEASVGLTAADHGAGMRLHRAIAHLRSSNLQYSE